MPDEKTFVCVYVTPRASKNEVLGYVEGPAGSELHVRVTAAPDGGAANKAVCKLVADYFDVPKTRVSVASGAGSRHKRLLIS